MGINKQIFCHDCHEKIHVTLHNEEFKGNGPLFSIAFIHNQGSRILVATFDRKKFLRRAYCHPIHQTSPVETNPAPKKEQYNPGINIIEENKSNG